MIPHGNSLDNPNLHHLYAIYKKADGDIFKFGISDDPIESDGLSERVRKQVFEMNRAAEYDKYAAQIILSDIEGRAEAARIERTFIDDYFIQNGRNPYGNLIPKRKL
jgi:URI fold toxin 2